MLNMKFNGCPKNYPERETGDVGKTFKLDEKIGF